jgi:hypothetical protein
MADNWTIPAIRMPTPEEHREASLAWLSRIEPTLIDRWPAELAALSMPTKLVRCPPDAFHLFCGLQNGAGPESLAEFAGELDAAIGWDRKFIRLNSRSPKDWPWPFEVPATVSGKEAVLMLAGSERIIEDLMEFSYVPEAPAFVCLREFVPWVRGTNEFRCFVKDGSLIAVSHYDYTKPVPETYIAEGRSIRQKIDTFFADKLRACLPVDTVVFDVAMDRDGSLLLIEINPYGRSDPCWFGNYGNVESAREPIQFSASAE